MRNDQLIIIIITINVILSVTISIANFHLHVLILRSGLIVFFLIKVVTSVASCSS